MANSNGASGAPIEVLGPASTGANPDAISFEEALRELEEVVNTLESGNVPLEQAIALLRRGLSLADGCDATLAQAELALEQLLATADGELITETIALDDEDDDEEETTTADDESY